jgi:cytochrome c551/c552
MDPMAGMAGMPGMSGDTEVTAEVTSAPRPGNAFLGNLLFNNGIGNPNVPACSSCHLVDLPDVKVGPSLQNIAIHAIAHANEHHVDLWTFLRTSIVDPNNDIMEAVPPAVFAVNEVSLMYQNYSKDLTETQINDIVAYLMTLK